jgi:hypothetical protein
MRQIIVPGMWISALLITLASCNKEFDRLLLEPEIAMPLFSTSTTLESLFGENTDSSQLIVSPEGDMMLVYSGRLVRRQAQEIFQAIPIFPGIMTDTVLSAPFTLENEIRIIRARFTSGNVFVQLRSDWEEDIDFILEFPDVTLNGEPLRIQTEVKYTGSLPVTISLPVNPIAGYDIDLSDLEVNVKYYAYRKSNGERVKLTSVGFIISGIQFSYLEGYFGYEIHTIDRDTIKMDIFENVIQGNLEFSEPRVTVIVDNAFGFPMRAQVSVLKVSNETASADLESPFIDSGFDFAYPTLQEAGQFKTTQFFFDKSNSNIRDIFNLYPIYLDYQIDAISNPDQIVDLIGFTTDSAFFEMGVRVELPLVGKAAGFEGDKTYDIDLSGLDKIREAELKLVAENGIPIGIEVQATLLDSEGQPLATLLPGFDGILEAAPVDAQGLALGVSRKETFIPADAQMMDHLRAARQVRIDARFSTTDMGQTEVRIRPADAVSLRMGIRATIEASFGDE